jgi:hypothetical protein
MRLDLTPEQVKTVEIALAEMFNSDTWIRDREEAEINRISARALYLLTVIEKHNKSKRMFTLNENR